jgi:hypothetical protein
VFIALFRVKRVSKAYLTKEYDHFIDGTVLRVGDYVGYTEGGPDADGYLNTTGAQYSGAYPESDIRLVPEIQVMLRWT